MKKAETLLKQSFNLPTNLLVQAVNKREWPAFLIARHRPAEALAAAQLLLAHPSPVVQATGHIDGTPDPRRSAAARRFEQLSAWKECRYCAFILCKDGLVTVFVFSRFLVTERPAYLYGAAVASGLAFYCKEHAVLLLPVFFAMVLLPRYRRWLFRIPLW